MNIRD